MKNKKILVVDDVIEVVNGIELILKEEGFDVVTALNGIEALEKMCDSIDLVVSDILMPEMDGIELCEALKQKNPAVKIILISGGGRQPSIEKKYNYLDVVKKLTGVEMLLKKPFNPLQLLEMINRELGLEN